MYYTVKDDDKQLHITTSSGIIEISIVVIVLISCVALRYLGYAGIASIALILSLLYYFTVAYIKFIFMQLESGKKYKLEKRGPFAILSVSEKTCIFLPVIIKEAKEEALHLYTLMLYVTRED